MADAVIYNPHSISFIDDKGSFNTWTSWNMLPTSRPSVKPPEVKTEFVEIPGMSGALDYTEALSGRPIYGMRKSSWEFVILNKQDGYDLDNWTRTYSEILQAIHGKRKRVILKEDDPNYYYEGRLTVNDWKSDKDHSKITIDYVIDPYKTPLITTDQDQWLWDSLFGISRIIYGKFNVSGSKIRTLINSGDEPLVVKTDSTSAMTVYVYKSEDSTEVIDTIIIPSGITEESNLIIKPGRTKVSFNGYGDITLFYNEARIL